MKQQTSTTSPFLQASQQVKAAEGKVEGATPSLFGSKPAQDAAAPSLFGRKPDDKSGGNGGSLFGNKPSTDAAPQGNSLFGSAKTPTESSNPFGSKPKEDDKAKEPSSGFLNAKPTEVKPMTGGSLFGPSSGSTSNLFGGGNAAPAANNSGKSLFSMGTDGKKDEKKPISGSLFGNAQVGATTGGGGFFN